MGCYKEPEGILQRHTHLRQLDKTIKAASMSEAKSIMHENATNTTRKRIYAVEILRLFVAEQALSNYLVSDFGLDHGRLGGGQIVRISMEIGKL